MTNFRIIARLTSVAMLIVVTCPSLAFPAERQDVKVPVEGRVLNGALFVPAVSTPAPAILVLHTRGGLQQTDVSYAADLAQAGFVSLAVDHLNPEWRLHDPRYIRDLARIDEQARKDAWSRTLSWFRRYLQPS